MYDTVAWKIMNCGYSVLFGILVERKRKRKMKRERAREREREREREGERKRGGDRERQRNMDKWANTTCTNNVHSPSF